jgi:tRNA modification GTPase
MFSTADTIVAIATPPGRGGLGVVRISGPGAREVAGRILAVQDRLAPRVATFTRVVAERGDDIDSTGVLRLAAPSGDVRSESEDVRAPRAIDQVVATFFPGPGSYTGEDVLEVSAHGSPIVLETIVRAAIGAGARLAEPGEFTLRAFLNGRIDLVQAEAVADLVNAVTPLQARAAFDQLEGTLTGAIRRIDAALFDLIARLEASIDFPDEGYHFIAPGDIDREMHRIAMEIEALVRDARRGRIVREGRQVVIAGKPNVGKSTLFNHLLGADRAIVTPFAGTTRDLVTETIDLQGVRVCLVDTAGVGRPNNAVDREGVARAVGAASIADVVLVVLDRSRAPDDDDRNLLASSARADRLVLVNKCDLPAAWTSDALGLQEGAIEISLQTGDGVAGLKQRLAERLLGAERLRDVPAVTNVRHIELLVKAADAISRARTTLAESQGKVPEEFLLSDLQEARGALEEVTGRRTSEELLRHIFGRFCIGK